jgi:hypothetical protein
MTPLFLSASTAAALVGRSKRWLVQRCRAGKMPFDLKTDGQRLVVDAVAFYRWADSLQVVAPANVGTVENAENVAAVRAALSKARRSA